MVRPLVSAAVISVLRSSAIAHPYLRSFYRQASIRLWCLWTSLSTMDWCLWMISLLKPPFCYSLIWAPMSHKTSPLQDAFNQIFADSGTGVISSTDLVIQSLVYPSARPHLAFSSLLWLPDRRRLQDHTARMDPRAGPVKNDSRINVPEARAFVGRYLRISII
jgi:hypothetical protein